MRIKFEVQVEFYPTGEFKRLTPDADNQIDAQALQILLCEQVGEAVGSIHTMCGVVIGPLSEIPCND